MSPVLAELMMSKFHALTLSISLLILMPLTVRWIIYSLASSKALIYSKRFRLSSSKLFSIMCSVIVRLELEKIVPSIWL